MVSQILECAYEIPVSRHAVWQVLVDPDSYPRLFTGIGDCEPISVATPEGSARFQVRIGDPDSGVRCIETRLLLGGCFTNLEWYCADLGALASVRLRGIEGGTRVVVHVFAPARVHPELQNLPNSVVERWLRAGLDRVVELVQGAPTAVLVGTSDAVLGRRATAARRLVSVGVVRVQRPDRGLRQIAALSVWGLTVAGGFAAAAVSKGARTAVVDDRRSRTFAEIHRRSNELAYAMGEVGIDANQSIGLLARNHVGLVETMLAASKLGADLVLLNAGLSGRQLEAIAQRERLTALFVDDELQSLVRYLHSDIVRYNTDDGPSTAYRISVDDLVASSSGKAPRPRRPGTLIVLTSGTGGTPKGARRPNPRGLGPVAAVLSKVPLRMDETMLIATPLVHTWGLAMLQLSTALCMTVVLQERFDAENCLRLVAENQVSVLVVVPTMVQRILDLPDEVVDRYDTASLRVVACGGAPLSGAAALKFMDRFGDILYNVYGSTEVSWATVATPQDLRSAPATVGRPPVGTKIAVLGPNSHPVPIGATGRIFVGNDMLFDGYVNVEPPEENKGTLDTGDVGYVDVEGRLFVVGRGDEMVISGGEKLFPRPIEEALEYLPQVREAAVVGVPDPDFGQRLAAFVVTYNGCGLDSTMLRNYIRNRLGRIAVPRDVSFMSALPRGETGKILKRLLVAPHVPLLTS